MYVCMYVCMYMCMYVCMHVSMYVCMHVCMCVCMYVLVISRYKGNIVPITQDRGGAKFECNNIDVI